MLALRLVASLPDPGKSLCAAKLAIFFQIFQLFGNMLPFPVYLVLVLWLRWPLNKTLLLEGASIHCCLHFISTYGLESGCCFLEHCTTSYLPVTQLVSRQRCIDLCDFEKLHCLYFSGLLLLLLLLLFNHGSLHLWLVFHLPLIWEYSWVYVHLQLLHTELISLRSGWKCCPENFFVPLNSYL